MNKKKIKEITKKILLFFINPRLLLCFGIGWMITNGWSYIFFFLGTLLGIDWMTWVGGSYLAFLWLPVSPEKIVTVAIAIFLLKWLFPNDKKTLAVLVEMSNRLKAAVKRKKQEHIDKKNSKK